ncbi:IclR family transcriptional regulator [Planomicrobium soli]|uniref:Glycerol operon regulatory protein n=1 Tax=Planomicrobium soli TaxID=1176648 RepID=A0A2P8H1T7_9BACL|nr:IclR family transcriptional regulator [Planomicrobium soli]PSL40176.1 IclR family transcriptional regulator [Planomicrobium soli]
MSNVQSLERAFNLLDTLSEYPDGLQITRLSEKVGLSKSTVHRLLATLITMNYVYKDPESEKYRIGYRLLYLTRNILNNIDVISIAKPFLEALSADVNETIHLCIEDMGEVLYVDKIESNQTIRMFSRVGSRAPMYCTGVGKMLLSGMEQTKYNNVVDRISFVSKTENTIKSKDQLATELQVIKEQGYALDNVENEEGIRCIAAPIIDSKGDIIASFSISGPSNRITMDRVNEELVHKITQTSAKISRHLGYEMQSPPKSS